MIKCRVCGKVLKDEKRGNGHICIPCYRKEQNQKRKNTPPKEMQFNHGKPWTLQDIQYLEEYGNTDSLEELAYTLGRSIGAVAQKKVTLSKEKKKKPIPWQITTFYTEPNKKKCSRCFRIYPASKEYFHIDNGKKDRLTYMCKYCCIKEQRKRRIYE